MILKPWTVAVDSQLAAFRLADMLVQKDNSTELSSGWRVDRSLLVSATPYLWSVETMHAVLEASKSIPLDTELNRWNLRSERSWWHFEQPLPFETLSQRQTTGVRALAFGFIPLKDEANGRFPPGTPLHVVNRHFEQVDAFKLGMPIVCWIDGDPADGEMFRRYPMAPSQVFEWRDGQTLGVMLDETRLHHQELYGPGGRWAKRPQLGLERYMETTEGIARFMLAAIAWLNQKVLITDDAPLERHRRKDAQRVLQRELPAVRVVSLRKAERRPTEGDEQTARAYHVRWIVSGHWRHQVCGPQRGDRRLTYILPYMKGPDDAPLRTARPTVYTVDR